MAKIYGTQAAADHVGVKSKQTISNWIAAGLEYESVSLGKVTVSVFDSETLEQFQRSTRHKPGPKPKAK
jgi:ssRNA-specific RNase YbeY (16S rRNA maturation enzyme)